MTWTSKDNAFRAWLFRANPGKAFLYHEGLLMRDRQKDATVDYIASLVWSEYSKGRVHLVQKREGDKCQYLAVRRPIWA